MTRIGVVSDVHMMSKDEEEVLQELDKVVKNFQEFDPDIIVVPGDVIQDEDKETDRKHLSQVREKLEKVGVPVRFLGGNHDAVNLSREELENEFGNKLWGHQRVGGEDLIFLDTTEPKDVPQGKVTREQLDFLETKLEELDEAIVFMHHPIHYQDTQGTYWNHNRPERALCMNKTEVNRIFADNPVVKAVFNGHIHYNDHSRYLGADHVTLNAFNKEVGGADVTGTYAEVDIEEGEIRVRIREGDELVVGHTFPDKVQEEKLRNWEDIDRDLKRIK